MSLNFGDEFVEIRPDPHALDPDGLDAASGTVVVSPLNSDGDREGTFGGNRKSFALGEIARVFSRSAVGMSADVGSQAETAPQHRSRSGSAGRISEEQWSLSAAESVASLYSDADDEERTAYPHPDVVASGGLSRRSRQPPLLIPRSQSAHGEYGYLLPGAHVDGRSPTTSGSPLASPRASPVPPRGRKGDEPPRFAGVDSARLSHSQQADAAASTATRGSGGGVGGCGGGGGGGGGTSLDVGGPASLPLSLPKTLPRDVDVDSEDDGGLGVSDNGDKRRSHRAAGKPCLIAHDATMLVCKALL
jgi:hypothetical protein